VTTLKTKSKSKPQAFFEGIHTERIERGTEIENVAAKESKSLGIFQHPGWEPGI
jgi:hypothetical protein